MQPALQVGVRRALVIASLAAASCGAPGYRHGHLPAGWSAAQRSAADVLYHHGHGGSIAAGVHCGDHDDVSLDVLTNHLLIGIEQRAERARRPLVVAGRAALRTQLDGRLDGVLVALDLVVLKKDGCTYDLLLVGERSHVERRRVDFDRFVAGFTTQARP
jgi:hypothetical protein